MQQTVKHMPDMTIYVTVAQREEMKSIAEQLDKQGIPVRDQRGNISYSALIRALVHEKAEALANQAMEKGSDE